MAIEEETTRPIGEIGVVRGGEDGERVALVMDAEALVEHFVAAHDTRQAVLAEEILHRLLGVHVGRAALGVPGKATRSDRKVALKVGQVLKLFL